MLAITFLAKCKRILYSPVKYKIRIAFFMNIKRLKSNPLPETKLEQTYSMHLVLTYFGELNAQSIVKDYQL